MLMVSVKFSEGFPAVIFLTGLYIGKKASLSAKVRSLIPLFLSGINRKSPSPYWIPRLLKIAQSEVTITIITIKNVKMNPIPEMLPLTGCYSTSPSRLTLVSWYVYIFYLSYMHLTLTSRIPCLGVACIFFAFTVYQFILALQDEENKLAFASFRQRKRIAPVISLFVRDGAVFFGL